MIIRPYRPADALALADLYVRSVGEIGSRFYTPEQIAAWSSLCPTPERLDALTSDGRIRLIAVDAHDRPLAFADLKPDGHIHFLYCAPEAAGQGAASELYEALEARARAAGLGRLHTEASEAALGFFTHKGFAVTARRDLDIDGTPIHNYAMVKNLEADPTA